MERTQGIKRGVTSGLLAAGALVVGLYSLANGYSGTYGLQHHRQLLSEESQFAEQAALIRAQREELEGRIQSLSRRGLDADVLDENARSQLGFVAADEVVILHK